MNTNVIENGKMEKTKKVLTTWLEEFRDTNYKNRTITNEFWVVLKESRKVGVVVSEILGNEILNYVRTFDPKKFDEIMN